jgi:hypothetical protein
MHKLIIIIALLVSCCFVNARDLSDVAYDIALQEAPKEFAVFKKSMLSQYATWEKDRPDGSFKNFLDERLLQIIPAIRSKRKKNSERNIKKIFFWLAMYADSQEPIPEYLAKATPEVIADFDNLRVDFNWKKLADFARDLATQYKDEIKTE